MKTSALVLLALTVSLVGCGKSAPDLAASSASPAGSTAPAAGTTAPAAGTLIAGWTDFDLSASGSAWKGWSVKAPPGAAAKKSFNGLEVASKDGVGVEVSFTNLSLDKTKSEVKEGVNYDQKPEILSQTKELLEWSSSYKDASGPKTMFGFHLLVKTSGMTMGCKQASGVNERAKLAPLIEACKTIIKK